MNQRARMAQAVEWEGKRFIFPAGFDTFGWLLKQAFAEPFAVVCWETLREFRIPSAPAWRGTGHYITVRS